MKRGESFSFTQLALIILGLIFLIWLIAFSGSVGKSILDAARRLFSLR